MMAAILDAAGLDPTVINGGIINAYGTNARRGSGEWMVVEADESDGTFVKLPSTVAIVTNIDPEHLDFYKDYDAIKDAFLRFVENVPFYGFAVLCIDHAEVQALIGRVADRRVVTYGFSPQADVRGVNLSFSNGKASFDVEIRSRGHDEVKHITGIRLPMSGVHNVQNALAVVAVAVEMGIADDVIRKGFDGFAGVKRRFTKVGEVGGVAIIDDYGHHPVEIAAVLKAARQAYDKRVIAVVQPHRYSRLKNLFEEFCTCFNDADTVIVADVYAAGEAPLEGVDRDALVEGLRTHGHRRALPLSSEHDLAALIKKEAAAGDVVVCLGAGSISAWANALPEALEKVPAKTPRAKPKQKRGRA
jgi:UDP-N-acetylmuramate--alanine ligase